MKFENYDPTNLVAHDVDDVGGLAPEDLLDVKPYEVRGYFADAEGATGWVGIATGVSATDLASLPPLPLPPGAGDRARAFAVARFSRDPRDEHDPAWRDLTCARCVLPRLTVTTRGGRTTARWWLDPRETPPPLPRKRAPRPARETRVIPGDRARWDGLVYDALDAMRGGLLAKVVAARRVELGRDGGWDLAPVVRAAAARATPDTTVFAFAQDDLAFVGATPETLVARRGRALRTEALAGSLPRDVNTDDIDRAALLASAKDRHEHALVADMVRATIAPWCASLDAPEAPAVRSLRALHHLWTPFAGALRGDAPGLVAMAAALHPTPAVAGLPVAPSVAWLRAHEPCARGWYAGPVGWVDANGDGRFVVGIRSAVILRDRAWVYGGAGIVPGSDPAKEWEETAVKMSLMREALGA